MGARCTSAPQEKTVLAKAKFSSLLPARLGSKHRPRLATRLSLALMVTMVLCRSNTAHASGTTYYISNGNCSNASSGTTSASPWCDFSRPNAMTFGPGDQILLASGSYWNTTLAPSGVGSTGVANHITIGCYNTTSSCNTSYLRLRLPPTLRRSCSRIPPTGRCQILV